VLGKAVYGIGQAAQLLVLPEGTLVKAADTIYAQCGPLASAFRAAWPSGSFNELVGEIYNAPRFVRPEAKAVMSRALTVKIDDAPDWAILALGLAGEQTRADYGVKWGFSQKRKFSKTAAKVRELIAKAPPVVKYWPNAAQLARA
jgi:hypothetical protein